MARYKSKSKIPALGRGDRILENVKVFLHNPVSFFLSLVVLFVVDSFLFRPYAAVSPTVDFLSWIGNYFYGIAVLCYLYLTMRDKKINTDELSEGGEIVWVVVLIAIVLGLFPTVVLSQFFDVTPLLYLFGFIVLAIAVFLFSARRESFIRHIPMFFDSLGYGMLFVSLVGLLLYFISMAYTISYLNFMGTI
ncbi:hypothetical protein JXB01_03655 [Candidatus Micrarchaeota archaeon]|nr:hypothetical protein [Candidatus Micrarchaeota archaeon]